jgi:hypothetical protein
MGWKCIGQTLLSRRLSTRAKYLNVMRYYGSAVPGVRRCVDWLPDPGSPERFARLDARAPAAAAPPAGISLSQQARPDAMAELIRKLGTDGRIRHVRDARYFAWRFGNPLNEYRFLYAGDGDRLTGYLVIRRSVSDRFDQSAVHLSDWEAIDAKVKRALLRAAIAWGGFGHLMTWTATLSDDSLRILREAGFAAPVRSPRGLPCVLIRSCQPDKPGPDWTFGGRPLLDISSWDLRMLYSMQG